MTPRAIKECKHALVTDARMVLLSFTPGLAGPASAFGVTTTAEKQTF
jgi:hypothetical protein